MSDNADANENPWRWWWAWGPDPERYQGPFSTREEAVTAAKSSGYERPWTICEGRSEKLTDSIFRAKEVIEQFNEWNEERANPHDGYCLDRCTPQQETELENALTEAFAAWRKRHDLGRAWTLETRNEEVIYREVGDNE